MSGELAANELEASYFVSVYRNADYLVAERLIKQLITAVNKFFGNGKILEILKEVKKENHNQLMVSIVQNVDMQIIESNANFFPFLLTWSHK